MRNISKFFLLAFTIVGFAACKKDENKVFFEGGTPPVLNASRTGTIPLSFANADQEALRLSWTNPNYMFTTGVSSHDVEYVIEIDTTGANFTNPKRQSITVSQDLEKTFTVAEFNDILLNQLQLDSLAPHELDIRVTATISGSVPVYSNVLKYTGVQPYAIPPKVTPPGTPPEYLDGQLYITGSATPGNWMGDNDPELMSQKFTRLSKTLYVLPSINLSANNSYLFVPVYGNWSNKFGFTGDGNANNVNGDDFKKEGSDMKAPAVSGAYKIEVDFQRGKFTVTKL